MGKPGKTKRILASREDEEFLRNNLGVSRETMELLQIYVDVLVRWQGKTNLIANSTIDTIWRRHICDSAQCKLLLPGKTNWLDLGSGAGFPGIVLAILGREESGFCVNMVESNLKKCAFLRTVIRETGISANVYSQRIESVTKQFLGIEVVTARALTSLDELFSLTFDWLGQGSVGLFPKGREYLSELEKCRGRWEFDLIKHDSRIEENSVLLEIQNLSKLEKLARPG